MTPDHRLQEHLARLYLDAARQHLTEAGKILGARPEAERGTAAEEAALLIAAAQAEAALSAAGILVGGVRLSDHAANVPVETGGGLAAAIDGPHIGNLVDVLDRFTAAAPLLADAIRDLISKLDA